MSERVMETNGNKKINQKTLFTTKQLVAVAFLSAIAYVLMLFHLPIKFIGFLELEFSDVPAIIGGIIYGPVIGVAIELVKNVIKAITATTTAYVGEFANFVICSAFVIPTSILYRKLKGKGKAFITFGIATVSFVTVGALMNYFVMIPLYAKAFGGMEVVVGVSSKMVPAIKGLGTVVLFGIVPFNLVKGTVLGLISHYVYKALKSRI